MVDQSQAAPRHAAIRLLIEYDGNQMTVIDRRPVEMAAPPSDAVTGFEGQSGFWFELRDAQDQVLYRRISQSPIQQEVEAFEPDGSATRHVIDRPKGVFTVLVPDLAAADHVAVVSSPLEAHATVSKPAELLTRIPLRGQGG